MSPQARTEYETKLATLPRSAILFGEYRKALRAFRAGQSVAVACERITLCRRELARRGGMQQ